MSETLTGWQIQYIRLLKDGMQAASAMNSLGVGLEEFSRARMENAAFAAALALVENGIGSTIIDSAQLLKLREAQVSEKRCAAYFGMPLEEFKEILEKDKDLENIFTTGPLRGQANIQVAQYDAAISGDGFMMKHLGEHVLDQKSKTTVEVTSTLLDETIAKIEAQLTMRGIALPKPAEIVEVEYEVIDKDADNAGL